MSTELNIWLSPVSDDAPCGPDLEYDAQFRELEEAVSGRPDAEYGDTLVAAVPPDWKAAGALAVALMARTRDLRVIVALSRAWLAEEGIEGMEKGLALSLALLEREWNGVHPQLDAHDADDPTARLNALAAWVDPRGVLAELMDAPLTHGSARVTLREWSYANGEVSAPEGRAVMSVAEIEAALAQSRDEANRSHAALDAASAHVANIEKLFVERLSVEQAPDLGALSSLLHKASSLLAACGGERAEAPQETHTETLNDAVSGRADVAATLERICAYYARHEPASPVPLLLARARSLIDKSFVDLMKELAPEGIAQLTQVIGTTAVDQS